MKNYHITIMSIDPDDRSEDNHQKYGVRIKEKDKKNAEDLAVQLFQKQNPDLPIFWVKSFEVE